MRIDGSAFGAVQFRAPQAFAGVSSVMPDSGEKKASGAGPADSAVLGSTRPAASDPSAAYETQALAQADEADASDKVRDAFLAYAQKTPMERMRDQILKELGYTEESLRQAPADERAAVEDKIRTLIEEKMKEAALRGGANSLGTGVMA